MNLSKLFKPLLVSAALTIGLAGCGTNQSNKEEEKAASKPKTTENQVVNIYTARHYDVDEEIYKKFYRRNRH